MLNNNCINHFEKIIKNEYHNIADMVNYLMVIYGGLWWIMDDAYAAIGDGGNIIYINKEKQMVVSIISSFMNRAKDRMELINKEILPLFK